PAQNRALMVDRRSASPAAVLAPEINSRLRALVREVPDFPRAGIGFKDITPLIADRDALADAVRGLTDPARPRRPQAVLGALALCELVEQLDAEVVGCGFLIELSFLGGRERLAPREVHALLEYDA